MWLALDLLLVAVFATVGRLSHDDSLTVAGWWTTAWPFLAGTLLVWAALAATRRPPAAVTSERAAFSRTPKTYRMAADTPIASPNRAPALTGEPLASV